jgi:hypothetical protein
LSDFLSGNEVVPDERRNDARRNDERNDDERRNDARSKAKIAEDALLGAMRTASAVNVAIHDMAAAVPKANAPVPEDAPLPMLLRQPDGIAKLMMASNAGISVTIGGMRQLPAMRAEEAAAVPGTQTVYPPDEEYPPDGEQPPFAGWERYKEMVKLIREAEAARAAGDVVLAAQAARRLDEILRARNAGTGGEDDPRRATMEAIRDELRAIVAGKYDKA